MAEKDRENFAPNPERPTIASRIASAMKAVWNVITAPFRFIATIAVSLLNKEARDKIYQAMEEREKQQQRLEEHQKSAKVYDYHFKRARDAIVGEKCSGHDIADISVEATGGAPKKAAYVVNMELGNGVKLSAYMDHKMNILANALIPAETIERLQEIVEQAKVDYVGQETSEEEKGPEVITIETEIGEDGRINCTVEMGETYLQAQKIQGSSAFIVNGSEEQIPERFRSKILASIRDALNGKDPIQQEEQPSSATFMKEVLNYAREYAGRLAGGEEVGPMFAVAQNTIFEFSPSENGDTEVKEESADKITLSLTPLGLAPEDAKTHGQTIEVPLDDMLKAQETIAAAYSAIYQSTPDEMAIYYNYGDDNVKELAIVVVNREGSEPATVAITPTGSNLFLVKCNGFVGVEQINDAVIQAFPESNEQLVSSQQVAQVIHDLASQGEPTGLWLSGMLISISKSESDEGKVNINIISGGVDGKNFLEINMNDPGSIEALLHFIEENGYVIKEEVIEEDRENDDRDDVGDDQR